MLQKSINGLVAKVGASQMRFWGKIKGTQKDYFVAEGFLEGGEEADLSRESTEARGTGANQYVYWVCNNPLEDWIQLSDLIPSQIIQSRNIKVSITGQINAKVFTNPFYFD